MRLAFVFCLCACAGDSLDVPTGERVKYVASDYRFPTTNEMARQLGMDLNRDEAIDNQLGMVLGTLAYRRADPAVHAQDLFDRGQLIPLVELQHPRSSEPDDVLAVTLFDGTDPSPRPCLDDTDKTCRRHLQGDGAFVAVGSNPSLLGTRDHTAWIVGPDTITVSLPFFGQVLAVELIGARVRIEDSGDDSALVGSIAGAMRRAEVETKLVPAFAAFLEEVVAAQCTARNEPIKCGCYDTALEYEANYWLDSFDINPRDCVISREEILAASITQSLTAPDVTIDREQALSFGFGFDAVRAQF